MFPQKRVSKSYYDILGVPETAREEEIKKAYKKAAIKMHPDKRGGSSEKFKELVEAFETLSDPVKRIFYDTSTTDARRDGMSDREVPEAPRSMTNLFYGLRQTKGDDVIVQLQVTLEDLFNGRSMNLAISRIVTCSKCKGNGSKSGELLCCPRCLGTAINITPETMEVVQHGCLLCKGTGVKLREEDKCDQCQGRRTVQRHNSPLSVTVKKGMQHGHRIRVKGLANEWPDRKTGDVIVVLQLVKHPKFKLRGYDLVYDHTLTLTEALCGFQFQLTHLDNKRFLISVSGRITKNGQCAFMKDAGMSIYSPDFESSMRGRLYIHFKVEFPETGFLTSSQVNDLETILPPRPPNALTYRDLLECEDAELHFVSFDATKLRERTFLGFDYTLLPWSNLCVLSTFVHFDYMHTFVLIRIPLYLEHLCRFSLHFHRKISGPISMSKLEKSNSHRPGIKASVMSYFQVDWAGRAHSYTGMAWKLHLIWSGILLSHYPVTLPDGGPATRVATCRMPL